MLLYEEIRLGCRMYHERDERGYDGYYARYIADKDQTKWDNPDRLDENEVKRLVYFVNQWGTMMPKNDETIRRLLNNLTIAVPLLNTLRGATLLDVKFDETTMQMIAKCFGTIASSAIKTDGVTITIPVGTSKMLNAAINPNLFVMWDRAIQSDYGLNGTGYDYAHEFLPGMQAAANRAVKEVMDNENLSRADAIQSFTEHCEKKNTLAKIIDEYNYSRFTKVWI